MALPLLPAMRVGATFATDRNQYDGLLDTDDDNYPTCLTIPRRQALAQRDRQAPKLVARRLYRNQPRRQHGL
jgi:hypothetical protein